MKNDFISGTIQIAVLRPDRHLPQTVPAARLKPPDVRHFLPVRDHRGDQSTHSDAGHAGDQGSLHSPDQ